MRGQKYNTLYLKYEAVMVSQRRIINFSNNSDSVKEDFVDKYNDNGQFDLGAAFMLRYMKSPHLLLRVSSILTLYILFSMIPSHPISEKVVGQGGGTMCGFGIINVSEAMYRKWCGTQHQVERGRSGGRVVLGITWDD